MGNRASINQVWKSGFSFLTVGFAIVLTSLIFFGIGIYLAGPLIDIFGFEGGLIISGLFTLIGFIVLLVGYIGLMRKVMTDGITLGLENGKQFSNSSKIVPMNFKETISSGFDLIVVIIGIVLISVVLYYSGTVVGSLFTEEVCTEATWFSDPSCEQKQTDFGSSLQMIFQVVAGVILLSGILGTFVKIVGDSISHAVKKTGYGSMVPQQPEVNQVIIDERGELITQADRLLSKHRQAAHMGVVEPRSVSTELGSVTTPLQPVEKFSSSPSIPATGLPDGWTEEQWRQYGQQYLDGTL